MSVTVQPQPVCSCAYEMRQDQGPRSHGVPPQAPVIGSRYRARHERLSNPPLFFTFRGLWTRLQISAGF